MEWGAGAARHVESVNAGNRPAYTALDDGPSPEGGMEASDGYRAATTTEIEQPVSLEGMESAAHRNFECLQQTLKRGQDIRN
ncbi:hypothetical protein CKAH01_01092 [Colletotrichum kahawae]|uniref:Uncharacterized protein n=1 Tax=Colletotrichum kahawae TaxID=34407 RepID=A0AAE0D510_COLKA|nr:hypothetical protein CKAH01_01092 [Colletotrichum kahawae]